jgi:hypothetical protein
VIDVRAWLASASWACLCGIAASLFLTVSLVGLFVLFFGALISAMLAPLLLLLPADVQWTGWQWFAIGLAAWLAVVALLGALARWGYLRCRAVVFVGAARWPRASSIVVGAVAALMLMATVPRQGARYLPQGTPSPEPSRDVPLTV